MTTRGRPRKGEDRLSHKVEIRLTEEQFATYKAAGGPKCLRQYLTRLKVGRVLLKPKPTAHQPFPTVTVKSADGKPVKIEFVLMEH